MEKCKIMITSLNIVRQIGLGHVDDLSRCFEILIVEEGKFKFTLSAAQYRDPIIRDLVYGLEHGESGLFALVNVMLRIKWNLRLFRGIMSLCAIWVPKKVLLAPKHEREGQKLYLELLEVHLLFFRIWKGRGQLE